MVNTSQRGARDVPALDHPGIVAEVRRRGSSLRRLSREAGFAPSTVNASLYKLHPKAHAVIADFLGFRRHELWPHWYGPDDRPCTDGRRASA